MSGPASETDPAVTRLTDAVRAALAAAADPEVGVQQQRYMKSAMPYRGLKTPVLKAALRPLFEQHPLPGRPAWLVAVAELWDAATHREERYAAIALLRDRRYRGWARQPDEALLRVIRHLIVSGAWWDYVDQLASHSVGDLLRAHPATMTPLLRAWASEQNLWLRRTAILSQLRSKADTDTALLTDAIAGSIADPDFFARKAIGWALREYSKTDAAWVRRFVAEHDLAPLSRREALAWLAARDAASS